MWFYMIAGFFYVLYIFSVGFVFWLLFTYGNYKLQKVKIQMHYQKQAFAKYPFYPVILWTVSLLSLYFNYFHNGFDYVYHYFAVIDPELPSVLLELNHNSIVYWHVCYNMTMLRVMSFCLDRHWAIRGKYKFDLNRHLTKCKECSFDKKSFCYRVRQDQHLQIEEYDSLRDYYAYLVYIPVFITGPQISYNAFISQVRKNQSTLTNK